MTVPDTPYKTPPITEEEAGAIRTVGVEIEFGGLDEWHAARLIQDLYGGVIKKKDPCLFAVTGTTLGNFTVELDLWLVHADGNREKPASEGEWKGLLQSVIGTLARKVVPSEIAAPPIPWPELKHLDPLTSALRVAGGKGTRENLVYGFGMQLNPQAASLSAAYILSMLRAFLLLSDGLRTEMKIDPTRQLLPFIDRFPEEYHAIVLDPDYRPALEKLIDDYIAHNPTRNRELDLMPLFAHVDGPRVRQAVPNQGIKARPAFHYRLPNSELQDPSWGLAVEWNRWVAVEEFALDSARFGHASSVWLEHRRRGTLERWPAISAALLRQLANT